MLLSTLQHLQYFPACLSTVRNPPSTTIKIIVHFPTLIFFSFFPITFEHQEYVKGGGSSQELRMWSENEPAVKLGGWEKRRGESDQTLHLRGREKTQRKWVTFQRWAWEYKAKLWFITGCAEDTNCTTEHKCRKTPAGPWAVMSRLWFYFFIFHLWFSGLSIAQILSDCHFLFLMVHGPPWTVYFIFSRLRGLDQEYQLSNLSSLGDGPRKLEVPPTSVSVAVVQEVGSCGLQRLPSNPHICSSVCS